ncbi:BDH_1b_G0010500.mRNA.1.CDS.1 [Saccharomyces cerevisiae]|nr:CDC1p putative lipid phosphatase of the endoplasmic reticulum [Saccharomyces boulardii (nom. inval.)]CAI4348083.1 BDH_1b_G0010500.mRNA.1.CDS.1 [Saccharomyces cerevisiae]KQC44794.1 putative lipid phosphatase of the endoplasmic reticulum [Saccharomyces boulardii (nom. inval.)]CAI5249183.1 CKB_HP2_G0010190.mRNA.1.CDS.1 [Saccharomyces cerevisiae]CAI6432445.1 CKB_HP2_G0010190.mRNA.1.CDS.1 [Saccharomyces cerevisiae]
MVYRNRSKSVLSTHSKKSDDKAHYKSRSKKKSKSRSKKRLRIYWRYISIVWILWLGLISYYESVVVKRAMKKCQWSTWEDWPEGAESHRVGLFADPQIMDEYSYPGRPQIVNYFTRVIVDHYHRRNWKYVQYYLDPDSNFFLGDLFDGGRNWDDKQWIKEYTRFNQIFPKKPLRRTVMSLPGNHDIGFGDTVVESSLQRFSSYFGETSSSLDAGNHTFVLLDTISLSDKTNPNVSRVPRQFLDNFAMGSHPLPRILLTHVPLWRDPEQQTCGQLRESKEPFPIQKGHQYQTVIENDISQEILTKIQPEILFSGDDHDHCQISHSYPFQGKTKNAQEITVKSCAMNMGISRPAIQLLSLYNPSDLTMVNAGGEYASKTYQTELCYMPDPYKAIRMYLWGLLSSAAFIAYMHFFPKSFNNRVATIMNRVFTRPDGNTSDLPLPTSISKSKSKKSLTHSKYAVNDTRSIKQFLVNAIVLFVSVMPIFIYFYTVV